ncbi:unnamed protein product [Blepharisma stoltei]|uniref:Uncharacterized protein n=1 Tax=Blepharisma stoltei TaxID=1481888 RepID=A0AAU9KEH8_9CILI|nr:unnamed protein product [Blepharisma stoltei]
MVLLRQKFGSAYPVNSERSCSMRGDFASAVVSSVLNPWSAGVEAKMEAWCNGRWHGDSTWWSKMLKNVKNWRHWRKWSFSEPWRYLNCQLSWC